jgi:hypothetical protein
MDGPVHSFFENRGGPRFFSFRFLRGGVGRVLPMGYLIVVLSLIGFA